MTWEADNRLARTRVAFANAAVVALALVLPVLITAAVGGPGSAGVTVLALVAAVLIAIVRRDARYAVPAAALRVCGSVDPDVGGIGEPNNPPHSPIRPRAPGLA